MDAGELLRGWRERRHLSQLELSLRAEVSTRHLSWVETGRSRPGRELLHRLFEVLDVPLRARNDVMLAAGLAPAYGERSLDDEGMWAVREALEAILVAHEPFPAIAMDESFTLLMANSGCGLLLAGVDEALLTPPINVMRLALHPDGLARHLANLDRVRPVMLTRVRREAERTGSPVVADLMQELEAYPGGSAGLAGEDDLFVPMVMRAPDGRELRLINVLATFGTAHDVTIAGLSTESFFPADEASRGLLIELAPLARVAIDQAVERHPELADLVVKERGTTRQV